MALADHWPLFSLRISTPRLELFVPTDDDLEEVLQVAAGGIHDPATMPFTTPWTDAESPAFERSALQYWWGNRVGFRPDHWDLNFAVRHQGTVIGTQGVKAVEFPVVRTAETGSWLGLHHQGQGLGKEMRRAVLHFAFESLGAHEITSGAYIDNPASQAVSRAVGYEDNGHGRSKRRDGVGEQVRFRITRERWLATRTDMPIEVDGFAACADMFGLDSQPRWSSAPHTIEP